MSSLRLFSNVEQVNCMALHWPINPVVTQQQAVADCKTWAANINTPMQPCWPQKMRSIATLKAVSWMTDELQAAGQRDCVVTFERATYGKVSMASIVSSPDPPSI